MEAQEGTGGRAADRKRDHLALALDPSSQGGDAGWDDVVLVPRALPELSVADVDLATPFLGRELRAPLVLVPMVGGHPEAAAINAALGAAAERLGLAVGVGSQRVALAQPEVAPTFAAVRRHAPTALVLSNIGAGQLVDQGATPALTDDDLRTLVEMVGADALSIHLNAAQEMVQPGGDEVTGPFAPAIAHAVEVAGVPVVAKQTGSGMVGADADVLVAAGIAGLDVGGAGGTSFTRIEAVRAERAGDARSTRLGALLADWGLGTAASVLEVRRAPVPVIATGGVRHGLDAARALALGATAVGLGRLAVVAAQQGPDVLTALLEDLLDDLRSVMVLCGARTPAELRAVPPVLLGATAAWADQRHLR